MGFIRALARLLVMGAVMGAVLTAAAITGVALTTAMALGIVLAGIVGLVGVARRTRAPLLSTEEQMAAILAPTTAAAPPAPAAVRASDPTTVEAMAPRDDAEDDPEANMPRWRRPSLLEARHSDPTRAVPAYRIPMRFGTSDPGDDLRVVRYAVVPVLDRPDEVLGLRLSDLAAGDEVSVVGSSGAFVEVSCPNGDRGWVHRTTLGQPIATAPADPNLRRLAPTPEADDALNALLTARGLI
jgi:hypothetical protein